MKIWFEVHIGDDGVWNLYNQHKSEEAAREEIRLLRRHYVDDCTYRIVKCEVVADGL